MKMFEDGFHGAMVYHNDTNGKWEVAFFCYGSPDCSVSDTGVKSYKSEAKAIEAAKRYINKSYVL